MLAVKNVKKVPAKAGQFCYILDSTSKKYGVGKLKKFNEYIGEKKKDKKNQLLRLIDGENHLVVALIHKDKKESLSDMLENLRKLGHEIGQKFNAENAKECCLFNLDNCLSDPQYLNLLEGMLLGNYQFRKYKKANKDSYTLKSVLLVENGPKSTRLKELMTVVESTCIARDLINEPVITLNAVQLGKEIVKLGKKSGFSAKILHKADIVKLKMGGLLGVNKGSIDPPIFAILEWKPSNYKNKRPYILVGKGVVYDTGGNNLKTGNYMPTMKCDMSGAAAVIGTVNAICRNKLPIHVIGLIPATDNRIGGNALVPDDVITMSDGSTVEVLNTDAEGRLILADALSYARKYKPKLVIDLATLTGAASAITGTLGTIMMGSADEKDKSDLKLSGDLVYERLAELPFWKEYGNMIKSNVADIKNVGSGFGGAITAGKFLEYFTDYPWIHLDIAGPAFLEKKEAYKPQGGSGVGVRLLYQFLKSRSGR